MNGNGGTFVVYVKEPHYMIGVYRKEYFDSEKHYLKAKTDLIAIKGFDGDSGTKVFTEAEFEQERIRLRKGKLYEG